MNQNFPFAGVRHFLILSCLVLTVARAAVPPAGGTNNAFAAGLMQNYQVPEWFRDAKFGLWLHWGPQTLPEKGGGWYARDLYLEPKKSEPWGKEAWLYHREKFGHQSEFGYKDVCHLWQAEKFDAEATVKQFKDWGAKYVAIMANHHDNFDLFNSSVHGWNSVKVGPHRDLVGEVAKAARQNGLKWAATVHAFRSKEWLKPAFGADSEGPKKGVPYDGNLTQADGKGKWWEGLDPQQLYASKYRRFESELSQRTLELVTQYQPDMLYFDDHFLPAPYLNPVQQLYLNSYQKYGSVQAVATIKNILPGTLQDIEKGTAPEIQPTCFQTDTTLASDWFLKPRPDGSSVMRHDARSLKELLADIVAKNGSLLLNIAVRADGTIPRDQFEVMQQFGAWVNANGEGIFGTRPWKVLGEGGVAAGGHFKERGIQSAPWDHKVIRFTRSKDNTVLFAFVFGNPAGKEITLKSLGDKNRFNGTIRSVSLIGDPRDLKWVGGVEGLRVSVPQTVPFQDCNVLKITTEGL